MTILQHQPARADVAGVTLHSPADERLVAEHLAHLRYLNYSPGTVYQRRRALLRLARTASGPLSAITEDDVRSRLAALTGAESRACELSHLRGFWRWALEYGHLDEDPTKRIRRPRLPRRLPRPICEADLHAALEAAPPRLRPWFLLAGWAGLRACEIARLRAEDIVTDLDEPIIVVRSGKGAADGVVPVSSWLANELAACELPRSGWLFPRLDGLPGHVPPHVVSHLSSQFMRANGIAATLHQLRHRFGTHAHRHSRDLRVTQELLRHRSPNSTAIYTFVSATDTRRAVEALPPA